MKTLPIIAILTFSLTAQADLVGGIAKTNLTTEDKALTLDIDGLTASVGYQVDFGDGWSLTPMYSINEGSESDEMVFAKINLEVESKKISSVEFVVKYEFNSGLYVLAAPSYVEMEIEIYAKRYDLTLRANAYETAIKLGGGYRFNDSVSVEYSQVTYRKTDISSIGIVYNF